MKKTKFKAEKYIMQRYSATSKTWSFMVKVRYKDEFEQEQYYIKTFNGNEFESEKQAYEYAIFDRNKFLEDLANNKPIIKKTTFTVRDVFELYLKTSAIAYGTKIRKKSCYNVHFKDVSDIQIKKLKSSDIQKCLNDSVILGCSPRTLVAIKTIWNDIIKTALLYDYIAYDPMLKVTTPKNNNLHISKDVKTDYKTLMNVIDALQDHTKQSDKSIFNSNIICYALKIMWYTGMRPSECFALHRDNIDLIKNVIQVRNCIGLGEDGKPILRATKTSQSVRDIPMTKECNEIIKELMQYQDSDYLLAAFNGQLMDIRNVSLRIRQVCNDENIKFNMYRLRHNLATTLVTSGQDIRTIKEIMGHNNIDMTVSYARSNNDLKLNALELLNTKKNQYLS